jgi:Domain of unknown function (DUF1788)
MSPLTIEQRLQSLLPVLVDRRFLNNQGIGNEVGIYIFDYDPEHELTVQNYIRHLEDELRSSPHSLNVLNIDLYKVILHLLEERKVLEKVFSLEEKAGNASLADKIKPLIRPDRILESIEKTKLGNEQLIFLTGVGASYPLLRSHTLLNNLQSPIERTPLVLFFPGSYDGHELRLFNTLKDDNYYRAFPLVPRSRTY